MNNLTNHQRKLLYAGIILVLLVPIVWLGRPGGAEGEGGGHVANLRMKHGLGEASLGQVDPSSATMSWILLGLRGIAVDMLWIQATEQQQKKEWPSLKTTVDSIVLLQPHYKKVWDFQSWNLSYNVSVEWDQVNDRYHWVKEGIKFLMKGTKQNKDNAELHWHVARMIAYKIGKADEWRQFRNFFIYEDPDENIKGPDPQLNPEQKDNYLTAQDHYRTANEKDAHPDHRQGRMQRHIFRSYVARSQFEYAKARQRDGKFDEATQQAWARAYDLWTNEFGQEQMQVSADSFMHLDATKKDLETISRNDPELKVEFLERLLAVRKEPVGYDFWKNIAVVERDELTQKAHEALYEGRRLAEKVAVPTHVRIAAKGRQSLKDKALTGLEAAIVKSLESGVPMAIDLLREELNPTGGLLGAVRDLMTPREAAAFDQYREMHFNEILNRMRDSEYIVKLSEAQVKLEEGMRLFAQMLEKYKHFKVDRHDEFVEEAMMAVIYWKGDFRFAKPPEDYPLRKLYTREKSRELELRGRYERAMREKAINKVPRGKK